MYVCKCTCVYLYACVYVYLCLYVLVSLPFQKYMSYWPNISCAYIRDICAYTCNIWSFYDQCCHWDSCTQTPMMMMMTVMTPMTHDGQIMIAQAHWHVCQMSQKATLCMVVGILKFLMDNIPQEVLLFEFFFLIWQAAF